MKIAGASAAWYQKEDRALSGNVRFEIVILIDGVRTLAEIRNAVNSEYGPIALPIVASFLEALAKTNPAAWK